VIAHFLAYLLFAFHSNAKFNSELLLKSGYYDIVFFRTGSIFRKILAFSKAQKPVNASIFVTLYLKEMQILAPSSKITGVMG
jgi:hypothetical protein